uniref:Large ribosomal subunit protein bL21c n=3 Tax=Pyropia TaxID=1094566 RepID=RK21_PYRYE|nr:ribosomal protein L21 [Neopyropia yezoensis]Q1XDS8.1 RecName: Full=Large ribosomal subunit protein bL21c; AltName: Full=50S ribosomal protein L21, chloroplastic [Neopyropia yezoensis]AIA21445.1 50S ribosomal protein L21 [Neopyropia fucicola]AGH27533.1 ribosomal protein L21 [Neopyropia yezoensis]QFZ66869.1 ribosomal protein L21 [Neopyropia yezoensis]ULU28868.1 ribosomal protein L21 [Neopyropia yezoensis]WKD83364.1 ribosomal protein L21 [Neopyropia yezoensis]
MTYAIIEASGTQLWIEEGRYYDLNHIPVDPGQSIILGKVLLLNKNGEVTLGRPCIEGVTIKATVMRHLRGKKITVFKMKPKKKMRLKKGHRQELTRLMIDSITS